MNRLLQACRQCYAAIGLAAIALAVAAAGVAGWLLGETAHLLGIFPLTWEMCAPKGGTCWTESYSGPGSIPGFLLWGALGLFVTYCLISLAKLAFIKLERLVWDENKVSS